MSVELNVSEEVGAIVKFNAELRELTNSLKERLTSVLCAESEAETFKYNKDALGAEESSTVPLVKDLIDIRSQIQFIIEDVMNILARLRL